MKLYLNGKGYPMTWKTQMKDDMWYSMEPARIKVTLPESEYRKISEFTKKEMRLCEYDTFVFQVYKSESDKMKWIHTSHTGSEFKENNGLWNVDCFVYSASICSKFRNGLVTAVFDVNACSFTKCNKSILRDLLLNELV